MKNIIISLVAFLAFALGTTVAQSMDEIRASLIYPLDDIEKAKAQIDSYQPGKQAYLVDLASRDWLKRALSMKKREQWIQETNFWNAFGPETPAKKKVLYDAFDDLKAAAVNKIPMYQPQAKLFVNKNGEEIEMLKSKVTDFSLVKKVNNIGLQQTAWLIAKDDYNLPISRYKQGWMWLAYGEESWTYPYCVLVNVNIIQDYAGGGTYGESYGNFISTELCGCPK